MRSGPDGPDGRVAPVHGPAFATMLGLGLVFCSMTLLWLSGYAWLVARAGLVLRRPLARRTLDAVAGTVLVAFGLRVAAEPARARPPWIGKPPRRSGAQDPPNFGGSTDAR